MEQNANEAGSKSPPLAAASTLLRDYSADSRMLLISLVAFFVGALASVISWLLQRMIGLSTNLFYFHRWNFQEVEPAGHHLGYWAVLVPVVGGFLVGLVARFGSPGVRGHGMPEAVEAIVFRGARVKPRVAFLKPIATALSIGSGGPFGAEGPVIMTGGSMGSLLGQMLPVTDAERSTLMVAGAAAGMAATFACPLSAVLLAVELLLFEWRPRSLVPVAVACATAGAMRRLLLAPGPIFPMPASPYGMHHQAMLAAVLVGVVVALLAIVLGKAIHSTEELFEKLPIHWMWFPAIGGLFVGLGGLIFPPALGIGYDVIRQLLASDFTWKLLVGVLVVKTAIWIISLSSNTAGGILAPLLMIGAAVGAGMSHWLPVIAPGGWAVVGMTALLAASIGAPLTCAMLSVELTHNGALVLPVLLACTTSYALSVLLQRRSLLTAGLSRQGRHLSREYGVDPLELVVVRDAQHPDVESFAATATVGEARVWLEKMQANAPASWSHWQRIFPILGEDGKLLGLLTRTQLMAAAESQQPSEIPLATFGIEQPSTLSEEETLRSAAEQMGATQLTSLPVVDANGTLTGILNVADLLSARVTANSRDTERNTLLRPRWPLRRAETGK
ncbi:chloride channel protein [Terriglobus saanensis]|uniref:Cl-channel voltage-gated family protein n=1 Tax=Terriglobus saanensis (strain ATCC BAA-1853 / DSM 23119 / SP1PR4) TaxID=401053 RepID=E8V4W1_TERSS|nr:chloride channel protein [Terriglobus saanensis]ADV82589.1 Cl- channel voltage-gated family protein [Terriglobus saanensis SP1PR4]